MLAVNSKLQQGMRYLWVLNRVVVFFFLIADFNDADKGRIGADTEGSLVAQSVKNLPAMQEIWGSIPGLGRSPGEGNGNPLQYSGEFHGQRRLLDYSPRNHKELGTTEQLTHTVRKRSETCYLQIQEKLGKNS